MALNLANSRNKGFPFKQMPPYSQHWIDSFGAAQKSKFAHAGHMEWNFCGLYNISQNPHRIMSQNRWGLNMKLSTLPLYMFHLVPTFTYIHILNIRGSFHSATHIGSLKDKCSLTYIPHVPGTVKRAFKQKPLWNIWSAVSLKSPWCAILQHRNYDNINCSALIIL
jgi:hypothetical protein